MFRRIAILGVFVGALVMAPSAEAALILFADNSDILPPGGDGSVVLVPGVAGVAGFSCFGAAACTVAGLAGWEVQTDTGLTSPPLIGPSPHMDLNYSATASAAGVLNLWLVDTDFTNPNNLTWGWGGTTGVGMTQVSTGFQDPGNNQWWTGAPAPIFTCTGIAGSATSCNAVTPGLAGTYSVFQHVRLTSTAAGQVSSGNFEVRSIPEPGSMVLLGTGLLGLAYSARRRLTRKA